MFNIVYALDDGFVDVTLMSINSLLKNKSKMSSYKIHLLYNNISASNMSKLKSLKEKDGVSYVFIDTKNSLTISNYDRNHKNRRTKHVSKTAFNRFLIADYIDLSNIDKILYIDGDTYINKDLKPMFDIDLGDTYAGVINDYHIALRIKPRNRKDLSFYDRLLKRNNAYFNSGVMMLNVKPLLRDGIFEKLKSYKFADNMYYMDQDILNDVIGHNCTWISPMYNYMQVILDVPCVDLTKFYKERVYTDMSWLKSNCTILHLAGGDKITNYRIMDNTIPQSTNRHDAVIVYTKCGVDSKENVVNGRHEIEYVVASLRKFASSWLNRIFVVGSKPPSAIEKYVIHIPCDDPYTHCKDANIIHKVRTVIESVPDLSDDFIRMSDDQIAIRPIQFREIKQYVVTDYSKNMDMLNKLHHRKHSWSNNLYDTLMRFPIERRLKYEAHMWSPINKHKFMDMCKTYDYEHEKGCIIYSLYYNHIGYCKDGASKNYHIQMTNRMTYVAVMSRLKNCTFIGWTDNAISNKQFVDYLERLLFGKNTPVSNTPAKNNKNVNYRKVQKIIRIPKNVRPLNKIH